MSRKTLHMHNFVLHSASVRIRPPPPRQRSPRGSSQHAVYNTLSHGISQHPSISPILLLNSESTTFFGFYYLILSFFLGFQNILEQYRTCLVSKNERMFLGPKVGSGRQSESAPPRPQHFSWDFSKKRLTRPSGRCIIRVTECFAVLSITAQVFPRLWLVFLPLLCFFSQVQAFLSFRQLQWAIDYDLIYRNVVHRITKPRKSAAFPHPTCIPAGNLAFFCPLLTNSLSP